MMFVQQKTNKKEKQVYRQKICRALFLFLCLFFSSINIFAFSNRENTNLVADIRVKNETVVSSDRLTLGNIAEIFSDDAVIAEKLRTISLGYSPNVGAVRELQRERILIAIASAGFSADEVRFESPQIIRIRRASQRVESNLMRAAVEDVVLNRLKTVGAQAQLTRLDIPASVDVPMGEVEVRASVGTVKDLFTPFSVSVEILVDGRVAKRISAMAQTEATMPVLVAARDIQPNERISEKDVCVETRKLSKAVTNYYRDFSRLRGADSSRAIAKGEIITNDSVVAGIVVKLGDTVRIMYNSGKFQIAVTGEARASGRIGERIQVKNTQSGNFLQAVIIDEGLVQVN